MNSSGETEYLNQQRADFGSIIRIAVRSESGLAFNASLDFPIEPRLTQNV
jgi:hypothetical protein